MQPRYVDFYDLPCSFAGAIATCLVIGRAGDPDEVDLAIEGFVGDGYFVRKDGFVNSAGHETHRVYVTTHEAYEELSVATVQDIPEPVFDIPAPPEPFSEEPPVELSWTPVIESEFRGNFVVEWFKKLSTVIKNCYS